MTIISVNINPELLDKVNFLTEEFSFSGRSDFFRAALSSFSNELKQKRIVKCEVDAVLVIIHKAQNTTVLKIIHKHMPLVKAQMHNHTTNKKCIELFLLNGDSEKIKKMSQEFISNKKIEFAKLMIS